MEEYEISRLLITAVTCADEVTSAQEVSVSFVKAVNFLREVVIVSDFSFTFEIDHHL